MLRTTTWLGLVLCCAHARAQAPCPYDTTGSDEVRYQWGGEMRQAFHYEDGQGDEHVFAVGDGGRIMHRVNGQPWEIQATPVDARQNLLDVWFRPEIDKGWACGVNGRVLETTDDGATWQQNLDQVFTQTNNCDLSFAPATLWRARFLNASQGFTCGLWTFEYTPNGQNWAAVRIYDAKNGSELNVQQFELYTLELLEDGNDFIGLCAGQEWGHCETEREAVVFYTDTREPFAAGGTKWWKVYDDGYPTHPTGAFRDPWDFEFDPAASVDLDQWTGYLVGGLGTGTGSIFRVQSTAPFGTPMSFTLEHGGTNGAIKTMYGVAALGSGNAIACGYGGEIYSRNANGSWSVAQHADFSGPLADACRVPIDGGDDDCLVVGSWGFMRSTDDDGLTWDDENERSAAVQAELWRLYELWFTSADVGFAVSDHQGILRTDDGGCSWTIQHGAPGSGQTGTFEAVAFDSAGSHGVVAGSVSAQGGPPSEVPIHFTSDGGATWSPATVPTFSSAVKLLDVAHAGGDSFWAVGQQKLSGIWRPLFLISDTSGATWTAVSGPTEAGAVPAAVSFFGAEEGLVVGWRKTGPDTYVGRAYKISRLTSTSPWDIDPVPLAANRRLYDIDTVGTSFAGTAWAVGDDGLVLSWDETLGSLGAFEELALPAGVATPVNLRSIAMAADGSRVLIGKEGVFDEALAAELGGLLRYDPIADTWDEIKSLTNKTVRDIFLLDGEAGWLVGRSSYENDSEFGSVGDSTVLRYGAE